jgi:tryptophanyl-tRNA synthetase
LFIQSSVLEHAELQLLLSMITPLSWLERVPTYKEQIENLKERDLGTYGFLGYPLLQAADIVMYGEPKVELLVPVGEDQVPHVELTREIVRRFNTNFGLEINPLLRDIKAHTTLMHIAVVLKAPELNLSAPDYPLSEAAWSTYQANFRKRVFEMGVENAANRLAAVGNLKGFFNLRDVLREPGHLLTATPRLPGLDGRRMSKSYGNAILLSDSPDDVRAKVRNMLTDPQRVKRTDPGRPEVCPVFSWHKLFSSPVTVGKVEQDCRAAAIGCVDCKKLMAENLVAWIEPVQARRKEFEAHPQRVWDILDAGGKKAHATARRTMKRVRNAIFQWDQARQSAGGN